MTQLKTVLLDFDAIHTVEDFHIAIQNLFGFPTFYGANFAAMVDCLSSLRIPEDEMSSITLHANEALLIDVKGYKSSKWEFMDLLLAASKQVNQRELFRGKEKWLFFCFS